MEADFYQKGRNDLYQLFCLSRSAGADVAEGRTRQRRGEVLGKEPGMAYKKPKLVAKSAAKQSFVAVCPTRSSFVPCGHRNDACQYTQYK